MRKIATILAVTTVMIAGLAARSALYADDAKEKPGSMMGNGMMGDGHMSGHGMMGMMRGMGRMMDHCDSMMRGNDKGGRPNDQWRRPAPKNDG